MIPTRERILALKPRGKYILAYTIRSDDEVRTSDEIFDAITDTRADPAMISIAEKMIEQQEDTNAIVLMSALRARGPIATLTTRALGE